MRSRRPPLRRCVECGGDCYGWSAYTRCDRCRKRQRDIVAEQGPLGLDPDGPAAEARRRRLAHDAEVEAMIARGEL